MNDFLLKINNFFLMLEKKYGNYFENGLIEAILYCCFSIIVCFVIYKIIKHFINKKDPDNRKLIVTMIKVFLISILLYNCLSQFKPVQAITKTLVASGGILALVLSLAAQESIGNLFAGIMIILFKPFSVGDLIKINNGEYIGYVEEITLRHTIIKTYEHNRITIPNSIMNKSSIENADLIDTKKANFLEISISYESNLEKAITIIQEEAIKHELCIDNRTALEKKNKTPIVTVKLINFSDNGIVLRAVIFSEDSVEGFNMLSDLRFSIKKRFDKEGIEIPYPYRKIILEKTTNKKKN